MFFKNPGILGDYAKAIFCLKGASTAEREFRKMVPSLLELSLKRVHDITVACPVLLDQVAATAGIKDLLFTSSDQTIRKRTVQCLSKFCINLDECAQIVVADKRIFPLSLDLLKDSLLKTDRQLKIFMHLGGSKEKLRQIMAFRLAETGKTFFRVMSKEMLNVATYYYRIKTTRSRLPYATAVLRICALCLKLDGVDLREEVEEGQLWFHASIFLWKEYCGKEITPRQAASQPRISWEAEESSFYTVMFIDPDVPRRTSRRRCHCKHWLVVNVPGNAVEKGHTEAEYFGPGPGRGSGLHRYTFLVFKQQGKLPESATVPRNELKGRFLFETASFAEEYKLTLVAANYLQAGYDSSVPQLYRSFAGCSVVFKNICPLINVAFRVGI